MSLRLLLLTIFAALCATVRADEEFDAANRAYEEGSSWKRASATRH
jgi:hypothetical protein